MAPRGRDARRRHSDAAQATPVSHVSLQTAVCRRETKGGSTNNGPDAAHANRRRPRLTSRL